MRAGRPLQVRLAQAGLDWSRQRFIFISVALGVLALVAALVFRWPVYLALGLAFVAGFGCRAGCSAG
jgi:tight adherence protein B